MRILHTQLGRHKCHLVGQSCALLARRVAFSIATIVWHTPVCPTVPLFHCPSSIALPGQPIPICPPHSAVLERNELNALPSTPLPLSMSFALSLCLPAHCHCQCHRRRHRHSSLCIFGVLFNTWTAHLNASTRLDWSPDKNRAKQSRARDELPRQLSIQSISIQSKLSESICLPSGIPASLTRSLGIFVVKVSGSFMPSSSELASRSACDSTLSSLDTGKQTNYLSSDSVFASALSAPCKYFHSHSHSNS